MLGRVIVRIGENTHTQKRSWETTRSGVRLRLKCDGTRAEPRFRLSAKRTSPFKSAGALVQSTTGSRGVRISGSNAGYTMFRGSVKGTGYPLHLPVSPSLPLPCLTICHHTSTGLYCMEGLEGVMLPELCCQSYAARIMLPELCCQSRLDWSD
jgi:hypothetical protein